MSKKIGVKTAKPDVLGVVGVAAQMSSDNYIVPLVYGEEVEYHEPMWGITFDTYAFSRTTTQDIEGNSVGAIGLNNYLAPGLVQRDDVDKFFTSSYAYVNAESGAYVEWVYNTAHQVMLLHGNIQVHNTGAGSITRFTTKRTVAAIASSNNAVNVLVFKNDTAGYASGTETGSYVGVCRMQAVIYDGKLSLEPIDDTLSLNGAYYYTFVF